MQTSVSAVHGASQRGERCGQASSVASVCAQARSNESIDNNAASSPVTAHVAIALAGCILKSGAHSIRSGAI